MRIFFYNTKEENDGNEVLINVKPKKEQF